MASGFGCPHAFGRTGCGSANRGCDPARGVGNPRSRYSPPASDRVLEGALPAVSGISAPCGLSTLLGDWCSISISERWAAHVQEEQSNQQTKAKPATAPMTAILCGEA